MRNIYSYIILPLIVSAVILVCCYKYIWSDDSASLHWHLDKEFTVQFGYELGWTTEGLEIKSSEGARMTAGDIFFGRYTVRNTSKNVYELVVEKIAYPKGYRTHIRTVNSNIPAQLTMEPGSQIVLFVYGYLDPDVAVEQDAQHIPLTDRLYIKLKVLTPEEITRRTQEQKRMQDATDATPDAHYFPL